jgi:hypothetical protein
MLNQFPEVYTLKDNLMLTHYMIGGSYTDFKDAASARNQVKLAGAKDATILAFYDGNFVPLNKKGVVYKVQLGAFKSTPDQKFMSTFKQFKDGSKSKDSLGLTHYLVGSYTDLQVAISASDKVNQGSVKGSFVVAFYNGNKISIPDVVKLP